MALRHGSTGTKSQLDSSDPGAGSRFTAVQRNWISQYAAPAALVSQTLDHTD